MWTKILVLIFTCAQFSGSKAACNCDESDHWQWQIHPEECCANGVTEAIRTRHCKGSNSGSPCIFHGVQNCDCRVNGQWMDWGEWSSCSTTCGHGIKTRTRTCSNPTPSYGGKPCVGEDEEFVYCNENVECENNTEEATMCSDWGEWSTCSVSCGGGNQTRSRNCTEDTEDDKEQCTEVVSEERACNTHACPVDGGFTEWSEWKPEADTCTGNEAQERTRTCTNPEPEYGGEFCYGSHIERRPCTYNESNEQDTTSAPVNSSLSSAKQEKSKSLPVGVIVSVPLLVVVAVVTAVVIYWCCRKKSELNKKVKEKNLGNGMVNQAYIMSEFEDNITGENKTIPDKTTTYADYTEIDAAVDRGDSFDTEYNVVGRSTTPPKITDNEYNVLASTMKNPRSDQINYSHVEIGKQLAPSTEYSHISGVKPKSKAMSQPKTINDGEDDCYNHLSSSTASRSKQDNNREKKLASTNEIDATYDHTHAQNAAKMPRENVNQTWNNQGRHNQDARLDNNHDKLVRDEYKYTHVMKTEGQNATKTANKK